LKTPISFDELQTFLLPLPNLWLLQIFPLRVAQIILLPNLHSLRAENIIRSHKVKVEVRDRPVKRISYFSSASYFPISYSCVCCPLNSLLSISSFELTLEIE